MFTEALEIGQEVGATGRMSFDPTRLGKVLRLTKTTVEVEVPAQLGCRAEQITFVRSSGRERGKVDSWNVCYLIPEHQARERVEAERERVQRRITTQKRHDLIQRLSRAVADDAAFSDVLKELVMTLPEKQKEEA